MADELVGFMMLADAGRFGDPCQILSSSTHRDKSPNNALIAKAVEVCAEAGHPHLVSTTPWTSGPLSDFKRQNGFARVDLPRYYLPLTPAGALALKCGLHHGSKQAVPEWVKDPLKRLRKRWYAPRVR